MGGRGGAEELEREVGGEGRPATIKDVEGVEDASEGSVVAGVDGEAHLLRPLSRVGDLALEGCSKIAEQATHRELPELGVGVGVEPLVYDRLLKDLEHGWILKLLRRSDAVGARDVDGVEDSVGARLRIYPKRAVKTKTI